MGYRRITLTFLCNTHLCLLGFLMYACDVCVFYSMLLCIFKSLNKSKQPMNLTGLLVCVAGVAARHAVWDALLHEGMPQHVRRRPAWQPATLSRGQDLHLEVSAKLFIIELNSVLDGFNFQRYGNVTIVFISISQVLLYLKGYFDIARIDHLIYTAIIWKWVHGVNDKIWSLIWLVWYPMI